MKQFYSLWIGFESHSRRFDFSGRSLGHVIFWLQEAGAKTSRNQGFQLSNRNVVNDFQTELNCFTVNMNIGSDRPLTLYNLDGLVYSGFSYEWSETVS